MFDGFPIRFELQLKFIENYQNQQNRLHYNLIYFHESQVVQIQLIMLF